MADLLVPTDYPDLGLATKCDNDFRPFLALGDEERTIVACQRPPGLHVAMYADCDCCACTHHLGPGWSSLRWNRNTPGALAASKQEGSDDA